MCGSPSVGSPYVVEPDFGADSRIWDDILRQWGGYFKYLLGRYAQTGATSPRDFHLNPFQGKAPIPQQPITSPPYKPPIGRADRLKAVLNERGLLPWAPQMAPAICQLPPLSQSRPATLYQQTVHLPAKMTGLGVTSDSSATKPAPTDSQDTDVHGWQAT